MDLKTLKTTLKSLPVIRTSWKKVRVLLQPLWAVENCARFCVTAPNSVFAADKTFGSFYRFQRQLASDRLGWFCLKPFDHLYAHTDRTWKPCVDAFTVPKTQVWEFTIRGHGPFDYFMSADMGRLRAEMIEGKLGIAESICAACTSRERIGLTSPRQKRLQAITIKDPRRLFNLYRSLTSAESSERYRPRGRIISVADRVFRLLLPARPSGAVSHLSHC